MEVSYAILPTPEKGGPGSKGLFATAPIAKGTLIWNIHKAKVKLIPLDAAEKLCAEIEAAEGFHVGHDIFQYSYFDSQGNMVDITNDDGRYFNHSNEPNTCEGRQFARMQKEDCTSGTDSEMSTDRSTDGNGSSETLDLHQEIKYDIDSSYALRDIAAGEELMSDYGCF
jgi:hypothetical protein